MGRGSGLPWWSSGWRNDCGEDLRAPGFPEILTDREPEEKGAEVKIVGRRDLG